MYSIADLLRVASSTSDFSTHPRRMRSRAPVRCDVPARTPYASLDELARERTASGVLNEALPARRRRGRK